MKNKFLLPIVLMLLWPIGLKGDDQKPETNINERYVVEKVEFAGIEESKVSKTLRDDAQKMVGEKYSEQTAHDLARRLLKEIKRSEVEVKVERGDQPDHVKVVLKVEKKPGCSVSADLPLLVYHSKEGFSGSLEIPIETQHNVFTFGLLSDADRLLERYSGLRLRYEHRKIGTDKVRLRIDFDSYHERFNPATEAGLTLRPDVPGIYRSRQNFAPSLSVFPLPDISLSAGLSFQRLQIQYPSVHTGTAYSGTADLVYHHKTGDPGTYRQDFTAAYGLRTATRVLDSDFVYTRHFFNADYTLSQGKNLFGAHFVAGFTTGTPPLFERFSLGNTLTLRGWNKFDVDPLGGTRAAHGSLEYRYRHFQVFYDVGTVWDTARFSQVKHSLGFGWASRHLFASLAFPVRLHDVSPVFMIGLRE